MLANCNNYVNPGVRPYQAKVLCVEVRIQCRVKVNRIYEIFGSFRVLNGLKWNYQYKVNKKGVDQMRNAYIMNTNRTHRPDGEDELDMLLNEKCAAFFSPWKERINLIQPNDLVFLSTNYFRPMLDLGICT